MQIYEILNKKKQGLELSSTEIYAVVDGFTAGIIPDYQMSALLMAICLKGMSTQETIDLTMAMANSGGMLDLSELNGKTVDKHSTGGVGDKTTFIVMPILAALGFPVAKMSGRGLGHTGGTIDKLESIPGIRTDFSPAEFLEITTKHGLCISGQSGNLVPADKKIYALRDVTATVDSIPLIAASIMSKKIAAGAEHILLDVKSGSGAFMKDLDSARKLADAMVSIGNGCGRKTAAVITDMSAPLGNAIGNSLEIKEAIQVMTCMETSPQDLVELCVSLAAYMLNLAGEGELSICRSKVKDVLKTGLALKKFADMVEAQGGDRSFIEDPQKFEIANYEKHVMSIHSGYINSINTEGVGIAAMMLGAGRKTADDEICYSSGIILRPQIGCYIDAGQTIATLYTNDFGSLVEAENKLMASFTFTQAKPTATPLIHGKI